MLSIQISNVKKMMMLLLKEDAFDKFLLYSAIIKNYCTTQIDGTREVADVTNDSTNEDAANSQSTTCNNASCESGKTHEEIASWKELRPVCYQLISGKTLPKYFRFVLLTDEKSTNYICQKSSMTDALVSSFAMNIVFQNGELHLTTGVSYKGFTLDKSSEKVWDEMVRHFLTEKEIEYEE